MKNSFLILVTLSLVLAGCGSGGLGPGASGSTGSAIPSNPDISAGQVARAIFRETYSPDQLDALEGALSAPPPTVLPRTLAAASSSNQQDYILSGGAISAPIPVDDILRVYVNGSLVYEDPSIFAGELAPIHFRAALGDQLTIVAEDYFGACRGIYSPLVLYSESTGQSQVLDPVGRPDGCANYPPRTIYYDRSFPIQIPSRRVDVNIQDASEFDPSQGETTTLRFDLLPKDFDTANLSWTVDVLKDGAVFFSFPASGSGGPGIATDLPDGGKHVELTWDGKNAQQEIIEGDFDWDIHATACDGGTAGAGGSGCVDGTGSLMASAGTSAQLTVTEVNSGDTRADVVVPPDPNFKDIGMETVNRAGENYKVLARGLAFTGQRPDTITANVRSTVSNVTRPVTLTYSNTTRGFEGTFSSSGLISQLPGTTYHLVQKIDVRADPLAALVSNALTNTTASATSAYPLDRRKLGHLFTAFADIAQPGQAPANAGNFFHYGFEALEIEPQGTKTQGLKAVVKVANQANLVAVDLHGKHTGALQMENGDLVGPGPPTDTTRFPATLLSLACDHLDLRDYNNFFSNLHYTKGHPEAATLSQTTANVTNSAGNVVINFTPRTAFGGEYWFQAFSSRTILLGYSVPAPEQELAAVMPFYQAELKSGTSQPLAWMRANLKAAASTDGLGWLCLGACAYDTNGDYYYIAFPVPNGSYEPLPPSLKAGSVKPKGIYRVSSSRWNTEAVDWRKIPQEIGPNTTLASKVE